MHKPCFVLIWISLFLHVYELNLFGMLFLLILNLGVLSMKSGMLLAHCTSYSCMQSLNNVLWYILETWILILTQFSWSDNFHGWTLQDPFTINISNAYLIHCNAKYGLYNFLYHWSYHSSDYGMRYCRRRNLGCYVICKGRVWYRINCDVWFDVFICRSNNDTHYSNEAMAFC